MRYVKFLVSTAIRRQSELYILIKPYTDVSDKLCDDDDQCR